MRKEKKREGSSGAGEKGAIDITKRNQDRAVQPKSGANLISVGESGSQKEKVGPAKHTGEKPEEPLAPKASEKRK